MTVGIQSEVVEGTGSMVRLQDAIIALLKELSGVRSERIGSREATLSENRL